MILAMVQGTSNFHSREQPEDPLICHQIEPVAGTEEKESKWVKASVYSALALLMRGQGIMPLGMMRWPGPEPRL